MTKQKYSVTNLDNDPRKYREPFLGGFVIVQPGETVETISPPEESEFWKIEKAGTGKKKQASEEDE